MTNTYSLLKPESLRLLVLSLAGALAYPALAQTPATFTPPIDYSLGATNAYPTSIVVADVNGDNKLDLLTANSGNGTAGVLLGTGTGSFGSLTTYSTGAGSSPYGIAVADINKDGIPDLLTAHNGNSTVGIRLGTGTGNFGPLATHSVMTSPFALVVADINSDGNPDLLTGGSGASGISVSLGIGTGSFGTSTLYGGSPASSFIRNFSVVDLNGDSKLDVITANPGSNSIAVLLGTGTGSFGTGTSYSTGTGTGPRSVAAADVNKDGILDLLTTNNDNATFGVLLGKAAGGFSSITTYRTSSSTTTAYPRGLVVTDVNRDGNLDLLGANQNGSSVAIVFGTGTGTFGNLTEYNTIPVGSTTSSGTTPYDIAVADVNGDRVPDLLLANNGTNAAGVLLGTSPTPLPVQLVSFTAQAQDAAVVLTWLTASEQHAERFEVERSSDGSHFAKQGMIAAAGTSLMPHSYTFRDASLPLEQSQLFYRLRQVDFNGTATYSPVQVVHLTSPKLTLYPNPATRTATISGVSSDATVQVYDLLGHLILTIRADAAGRAELILPAGLPNGLYLVRSGIAPALRLTVE
jgi:hypothetical protein